MSDNAAGVEENITVGVRIRPLSDSEEKNGFNEAWQVSGGKTVTAPSSQIAHTFDSVFDGYTSTDEVFETMGKDLVSSVLKGMNGTIFAYGQTASGKTHTMEGNEAAPGILTLAINQIFDMIDEMPHFQFMIHVSYIEIFNEQVKDLLTDKDENLRIREDPEKGFFVDNLSSHSIISIDEIMALKRKGEKKRHVGETNMNLKSSRSHTIFTLNIEMRDIRVFDENNIDEQKYKKRLSCEMESSDDYCFGVLIGKLNLVDLAGSENAKMTSAVGERLAEAANINKSLLSLSRVISQLSSNADQFINWRDSKLTQILQPCLGGNCKTSVICCIRAGNGFFEESKSTLNFAAKTKKITNKVHVNEVLDGEGEIQKLKNTIKSLETKLQVQIEENENKPQLQEEIKRLKALVIIGGGDDAQIEKLKRRKKMRMTWCPGKQQRRISFAPHVLAKELDSVVEKRIKPADKRKSVLLEGLELDESFEDNDDDNLDFNETLGQSVGNDLSILEDELCKVSEMKEQKEALHLRIAELESLLEKKVKPESKKVDATTEFTMDNTYDNTSFETFAESVVSKNNKSCRSSVVTVDIVGKIELENKIADLEDRLVERDDELKTLREKLEQKLYGSVPNEAELSKIADLEGKLLERETELKTLRENFEKELDAAVTDHKTESEETNAKVADLEDKLKERDNELNKMKEELEQQLCTTQTEYKNASAERDAKIADLESKLVEKDNGMNKLKEELEQQLSTAQTDLENESAERDAKIADLENKLVEKENGINELEVKLEQQLSTAQTDLENESAERDAKIADLEDKLLERDGALDKLKEELEGKLRAAHAEHKNTSAESDAKIEELEARLLDSGNQLKTLEEELEKQVTSTNTELNEEAAKIADLESIVLEKDNQLKTLKEEFDKQLDSATLGHKTEIAETSSKIIDLENKLVARDNELSELKEKFEQQICSAETDAKISDLEDKLFDKEVELEILRENLEQKLDILKEDETKNNEKSEDVISSVVEVMLNVVENLPFPETRILEAEKNLNRSLQAEFDEQIKVYGQEHTKAQKEISALRAELEQVQSRLEKDLEAEKESSKNLEAKLAEDQETYTLENNSAKEQILALQSQISELHLEKENILEVNNKKLLELETDLKEKYDEDEKSKLEIVALKQEIEILKEQNPSHGIDFEEKAKNLEKALLKLKNENVRMESALTAATESSSENNDFLNKEIHQLRLQVDLKTQELEKLNAVVKEKVSEIQQFERSNEALEKKIIENEQIIDMAEKNAKHDLTAIESKLKSRDIEVENLTFAVEKLTAKNQAYLKDIEELKKETEDRSCDESKVNDLSEQVERQLSSIKALESRVEVLSKETKDKQEIIMVLETNLTKEQEKVFELSKEQEACTRCEAKDEEINTLKELSEGVKFSVASSEEKINELTNAVKELTKDKSELMNRLNRVNELKKEVEAENLTLQDQKLELTSKLASLDDNKAEQEKLKHEHDESMKTMQQKIKEIELSKAVVDGKVLELEQLLESREKRIEKLETVKLTKTKAAKFISIAKDRDRLKALTSDLVEYIKNQFDVDTDFNAADIKQILGELKTEREQIVIKHKEYRQRIKELSSKNNTPVSTTNTVSIEKYEELKVKYHDLEKQTAKTIGSLEKENLALNKAIQERATSSTPSVSIPKIQIKTKKQTHDVSFRLDEKENVNSVNASKPKVLKSIVKSEKKKVQSSKKHKLRTQQIEEEANGLNSPYKKGCTPS